MSGSLSLFCSSGGRLNNLLWRIAPFCGKGNGNGNGCRCGNRRLASVGGQGGSDGGFKARLGSTVKKMPTGATRMAPPLVSPPPPPFDNLLRL